MLGASGILLAVLELAHPAAEEVVDDFQLAHTCAEVTVLRADDIVRLWGFEVRRAVERGDGGRGLPDVEGRQAGAGEGVRGQGHGVEDVLGCDVRVVRQAGGVATRDGGWRWGTVGWCVGRRDVRVRVQAGVRDVRVCGGEAVGGLLRQAVSAIALLGCGRLDAVAALDHVGLEGDRARAAVQLEEEAAGIAEHAAGLVATPEWCGRCSAVLTYGLEDGRRRCQRWYACMIASPRFVMPNGKKQSVIDTVGKQSINEA